MKLITEITEDVKVIEEANEDGKKNVFIEGIFLQGNIKNRNGRIYRVETLEKEVKRYNEQYIKKNRAFGELNHPSSPTINLDRVSHVITSLQREGDNFIGRAKISSTPMGDIVKGLLSDGTQLGVSSRGMGSLKTNNEGIQEVQDDFYLATAADIVADPSAPEAFVNGIMEGVEYWFDDDGRLHKEIIAEKAKQEIEDAAHARRLNEKTKIRAFQRYLDRLSGRILH